MKKVFNNIMRGFIALSVFAIGGCADTSIDSGIDSSIDSQPGAAANIQTDVRESYDFTAISPMPVSFAISANTPWRIESDAQWCTVTPSMSAASSLVETITIKVEDNTEYSPREATVTIMGTDIDFVRTVAIKQDSNADLIVLTPSAPVAAGGEEIEITVHSNKAWEYFALTDILQNAQNTSGDGSADAAIKIKVPANPGLSREGQFMIRTALEERTYTIMQDGMVLRLDPDSNTLDFGWSSDETRNLIVVANVDWELKVPADVDWLNITVNEKQGTISVSPKAVINNFKRKESVLTVEAKNVTGLDPIEIPVSQEIPFILEENVIVNEDGSATITTASLGTNAIKTKYSHILGTWTIEFDIARSGYDTAHYNFILDDAATGGAPFYKVWLTPDVAHSGETAGFNNNCMQISNDAATWNAPSPAQRRNFDKSINGTNLLPEDQQFWWTDVCTISKLELISEISSGTGAAGDKIMHSAYVTLGELGRRGGGIETTLGAEVSTLESKGILRISPISHSTANDALCITSITYTPAE